MPNFKKDKSKFKMSGFKAHSKSSHMYKGGKWSHMRKADDTLVEGAGDAVEQLDIKGKDASQAIGDAMEAVDKKKKEKEEKEAMDKLASQQSKMGDILGELTERERNK